MKKKLQIIGLSLMLTLTSQLPIFAGQVLNKIKETGVIKAGYRKDSAPFGFMNEKGDLVGYSVDILELIRKQAEKELGKPIKLEFIEMNAENRFELIKNGTLDIECGSTTVTWEREKFVDFSVSYFASGTQMIVHTDSRFANADSLKDANIAVMPNTTNEMAMKNFASDANLIPVKNEKEGWEKLQKNEVDGFAGDGILLQALKKDADNPQNYEIVPEFPYMVESYACTIAEDESQWRGLVNYAIVQFMQGVVTDTPSAVDIYERWFGVNGETPYPIETMADYFQGIINGFEWIPIEERY